MPSDLLPIQAVEADQESVAPLVLVVEDNPVNSYLVRSLLVQAGFEVVQAENRGGLAGAGRAATRAAITGQGRTASRSTQATGKAGERPPSPPSSLKVAAASAANPAPHAPAWKASAPNPAPMPSRL